MDKELLIQILKDEIEESTGCTDPGGVVLAASIAGQELNEEIDDIKVIVSENIFKNGITVGIPGTNKRGLHLAAAIGVLLNRSDAGLAIMNFVNQDIIDKAEKMVKANIVSVEHRETEDPLYIKVIVKNSENTAYALIEGDYSNIAEIGRNNDKRILDKKEKVNDVEDLLNKHNIKELYDLIIDIDPDDFSFLLDYAEVNKKAALDGLSNDRVKLANNLSSSGEELKEPFSVMRKGQIMTAAAGEARMIGLQVPIMAIAGSGNHGITNFLGILSVGEEINSSHEQIKTALAISSMITIYIKGYIKRMTAFCGCSVAAATGVAAGTVYLLDGSYQDGVNAMQSVIGTLAGMFCDGAKESCAYKLSTATTMAIQFAYMAIDGAFIPNKMGIVGNTIEETFSNLGKLNNPGMLETDKVMVSLVENNIKNS